VAGEGVRWRARWERFLLELALILDIATDRVEAEVDRISGADQRDPKP